MNAWPPLLDGALRAEAERRVAEVAAALSGPADAWPLARAGNPNGIRAISLGLGRCGFALFHAWHHAALGAPGAADAAQRLLGESIEMLPGKTMDESLYCGFPGVAWTTEHVLRVLGATGDDDPVEGIDAALLGVFEDPAFRPGYDLIGGLAGLGVHALERRDRPTGPRLAERVLARLEEMARPQAVGVAWPSGGLTRRAIRDDVDPNDIYFNLGLSHGIPGIIAILARLASFPGLRARALRLAGAGVAWLREQRLPAGSIGAFPDYVAHDITPEPARLAWCYGDPGVASAVLSAGRALGDPAIVAFALEIAHLAARRSYESSQVVDAGLCHGTAGVAHVFHRLYRSTGDATCRAAALAWFERALERVTDRPNVAGFPTFSFERNWDGEYVEDAGLLTGAAGTGLALIAAISDREPAWDRFLLVDSVG
jgi:hypothetical protein